MDLTGENYLYNNPLACRGGIERKAWYAVPCCPSNLSRTWADLDKYIFSADDNEIWIHQYIGSQASFNLGGEVKITIESKLPWDGKVQIKIDPSARAEFTLHLRLPAWSTKPPALTVWKGSEPLPIPVEGQTIPGEVTAQGYDPRLSRFLPIQRIWTEGDWVEINFDMPIILRRAHPKVKGHQHKVAVTRGPLVYCLESLDNPGIDIFSTRLESSSLQTEWDENLFGGITFLRGRTTDGTSLTSFLTTCGLTAAGHRWLCGSTCKNLSKSLANIGQPVIKLSPVNICWQRSQGFQLQLHHFAREQ
jgi:hypothetical protein